MIRPGRALVRQSPWQGVQTGPSQDFDRPFCKDSHRVHAAIQPTAGPVFIELHRSDASASRAEIIAGLQSPAAAISPKYFYDRLGSSLFAAICLTTSTTRPAPKPPCSRPTEPTSPGRSVRTPA